MRTAPLLALSLLFVADCKHHPASATSAPSASARASAPPVVLADGEAPATEPAAIALPDAGPSAEALTRMRATFRQAADVEASDPARAVTLYEQAFTAAPSLAALLGEARAARAKGDEPLAHRSLAQALSFAERGGAAPRVALSPRLARDSNARVVVVENDSALLAMDDDRFLVRQDLATGSLAVVAVLPEQSTLLAASPHLAVVKLPAGETRVLALGIDDVMTAAQLDTLPYAAAAAISRDETLIGVGVQSNVVVLDARALKTLGKVALGAPDEDVIGFTRSGKRLVATTNERICVLSEPSWNACAPSPALRGIGRPRSTTIGGELIAFAPNDTTFRIFDAEVGRPIVSLTGHFASVSSLTLTPDGATLISSSFSRAVTWDVATHARRELAFESDEDHDWRPSFTPDGKRSVEGEYNGALVRDVSALSVWMPILSSGSSPISSTTPVATFAAGGHLWVGGNHFVAKLDLGAGTIRWYPIFGNVTALAVSSDEGRFAVNDAYGNMGANLYLYEASGKRVWMTHGYTMIGGLRFDADKLLVNTVSGQDAVDLATGDATHGALPPGGWPSLPTTSPDHKLHVRADADGTVTLTDARGRAWTIELGPDAYVLSDGHKAQVFGNRASALCNAGTSWLPLDACASLLGTVSL